MSQIGPFLIGFQVFFMFLSNEALASQSSTDIYAVIVTTGSEVRSILFAAFLMFSATKYEDA